MGEIYFINVIIRVYVSNKIYSNSGNISTSVCVILQIKDKKIRKNYVIRRDSYFWWEESKFKPQNEEEDMISQHQSHRLKEVWTDNPTCEKQFK